MLADILSLEWWEGASYVVTVIGLPLAIIVFLYEQHKERRGDDEEIFQYLSEEYTAFLKLVLEHADLQLAYGAQDREQARNLTAEQQERKQILYDILMSLFERAYMLVYDEDMDRQAMRLWASWEDYIRHWCRRDDFRMLLPSLLEGEDADFAAYMVAIAAEEEKSLRRDAAPAPSA